MAYYKNQHRLEQSNGTEFDATHHPAATAPNSGIYMCTGCGREASSTQGHPLPPQNHHQHTKALPILWQLIVKADHRHWTGH